MLLFHSIRALSSFWEFGEMVFLIPAALVIALLLQAVIFRNQRRPWLPIAVIGGLLVLCDATASLIILKLERAALGVAFLGMAVEAFLLAVIIGLAIGLLVSLPMKKKAAQKSYYHKKYPVLSHRIFFIDYMFSS